MGAGLLQARLYLLYIRWAAAARRGAAGQWRLHRQRGLHLGRNRTGFRRLVGANKSLWYAYGPQGETRQLTDSNGNIVDTYIYAAYGRLLAQTGSDTNPFQYGGQAGYYTDG